MCIGLAVNAGVGLGRCVYLFECEWAFFSLCAHAVYVRWIRTKPKAWTHTIGDFRQRARPEAAPRSPPRRQPAEAPRRGTPQRQRPETVPSASAQKLQVDVRLIIGFCLVLIRALVSLTGFAQGFQPLFWAAILGRHSWPPFLPAVLGRRSLAPLRQARFHAVAC